MSLHSDTSFENQKFVAQKNPYGFKSLARKFLSLCFCREFTAWEENMYSKALFYWIDRDRTELFSKVV